MSVTLSNPTSSAVMEALRREASTAGSAARTLAFTLIVDALSQGPKQLAAWEDVAMEAAATHPCRLILLTRDPDRSSFPSSPLEVEVSGWSRSCPTERLRVTVPFVDSPRIEAVLRGVLANDVPVVCWWPCGTPTALQLEIMSKFVQRRVFDSGSGDDPLLALQTIRSEYRPGDSDLSWGRVSALRSLVTASLDWRGGDVVRAEVEMGSVASALLVGNWVERLTGARVEYVDTTEQCARLVLQCRTEDGEDYLLRFEQEDGRFFTVTMDDQEPLRHVGPSTSPSSLLSTELDHFGEDRMFRDVLDGLSL